MSGSSLWNCCSSAGIKHGRRNFWSDDYLDTQRYGSLFFSSESSCTLQSLLAQRQQLTLRAGILYRRWEDVTGKGMQMERVGNPLQRVAMDILGPLPETPWGNKYCRSRSLLYQMAYAMHNMEASTVARIFVNEFVTQFSAPDCLHTDQRRNFDSIFAQRSV